MKQSVFLSQFGIICCLGASKTEVYSNLISGSQKGIISQSDFIPQKTLKLGTVTENLPEIPKNFSAYNTRCNQLLLAAYLQIEEYAKTAIKNYGKDRIGIVIGTGTTGIAEVEQALLYYGEKNHYLDSFDYRFLSLGNPAEFLFKYLDLSSIYCTVSTACSSSAKAFVTARNLIQSDLCDIVIVGGVDVLSKLTVNGFYALEAISENICNPFSKNNDGITLGEGASIFILGKEETCIELLGIGESSDAHHVTSPDPTGLGAQVSMKKALEDAGVLLSEIDYLNLHGTGTNLNDQMESTAVHTLFKNNVPPCSSTKPLTGHTLGAAGAIELGLCWLTLSDINKKKYLPPHIWDGQFCEEYSPIRLTKKKSEIESIKNCMSNSFAFGGSNVTLIIGQTNYA